DPAAGDGGRHVAQLDEAVIDDDAADGVLDWQIDGGNGHVGPLHVQLGAVVQVRRAAEVEVDFRPGPGLAALDVDLLPDERGDVRQRLEAFLIDVNVLGLEVQLDVAAAELGVDVDVPAAPPGVIDGGIDAK